MLHVFATLLAVTPFLFFSSLSLDLAGYWDFVVCQIHCQREEKGAIVIVGVWKESWHQNATGGRRKRRRRKSINLPLSLQRRRNGRKSISQRGEGEGGGESRQMIKEGWKQNKSRKLVERGKQAGKNWSKHSCWRKKKWSV